MVATERASFALVEGAEEVFTPPFVEYLLALHDRFTLRVHELMAKRVEVIDDALSRRILPSHLPLSEINTGDWKVPPVPEDLKRPGIEISGPASITSMFINALNPGPGGVRAEGDLDDDEDSAGHRLVDTVAAARNRLAAVERTLEFYNPARDKTYAVQQGEIPFFMHRERGLHLDEPEVTIDGQSVSAAILGTALTLFHAGRAQIARGQGAYFYLPKLESAEEAGFWREFFDFSVDYLDLPEDAVIRAVPLVESLPLVYQMEECLYELGPYAAGLNAARWDLKASIFEFILNDPSSVWPDRFGVDIKTTPFLANIFRRLVAICLKRGAVPIGGMATALPSRGRGGQQGGRGNHVRRTRSGRRGRASSGHGWHTYFTCRPRPTRSRSCNAQGGSPRLGCATRTTTLSKLRSRRARSPWKGLAGMPECSLSTWRGGSTGRARRASTAWMANPGFIPR